MKLRRKISAGVLVASIMLVASVSVMPSAGAAANDLRVSCIDWYANKSGTKWHAEAFVRDGNGNPVIGAVVTLENSVTTSTGTKVYQTSSSTTYAGDGVSNGTDCAAGTMSGAVTSDFCAPAKSPKGVYKSRVVNVTKAGYTWDGYTPSNSFTKA